MEYVRTAVWRGGMNVMNLHAFELSEEINLFRKKNSSQ